MNDIQNIHVSFILSTFNKAPFLDRVLNNIREFKRPDDELILMDGGSTDDTAAIVRKHKDIITLFESEKDRSAAHAYNKAMLKASGRIIINLNDDDYFYPSGIRQAIATMDEHPDIDVLICGGELVKIDEKTGREIVFQYQYLPPGKRIDPVTNLFHLPIAFLLLNRKIIPLAGIYDTTIQAADGYYTSQLLRCGANYKYLNVKMFKLYHYSHSSSLVHGRATRRDIIAVLARHGRWAEILRMPCGEAGNAFHLNVDKDGTVKDKMVAAYLKACLAIITFPLWSLGFWWRLATYLKSRSKASLTEPDWDGVLR
ncbi:MAG TPA: glycosyltransferase [Nitrospirota bacterium]|nr:glycosyltransferase [Nitrospirota bacterium]